MVYDLCGGGVPTRYVYDSVGRVFSLGARLDPQPSIVYAKKGSLCESSSFPPTLDYSVYPQGERVDLASVFITATERID